MKKLSLLGDRTDVGQANWKQRAERARPWLNTARGSGVAASRSGPRGTRRGVGIHLSQPKLKEKLEEKPREGERPVIPRAGEQQGFTSTRANQGTKKWVFREQYEVTASRYDLSLLLTTQDRRYIYKYIKN